MVHFSLEMPEIAGADVFLDGDFVQRRFDPVSRMVYNRATGRYENSMMLKQGHTTTSISPSRRGVCKARPPLSRVTSIRLSTNTRSGSITVRAEAVSTV